MGRSALALIAGFLAMSGVAFTSFSPAFGILGCEGVFLPGSYDASGLWNSLTVVLGFVAALSGGLACGSISPRLGPMCALVGIAASFGLAYAAMSLAWGDPGARPSDVGWLETQFAARSPTWILFANPASDTLGILLGGTLARRFIRGRALPTSSPIDESSAEGCPKAGADRPEEGSQARVS